MLPLLSRGNSCWSFALFRIIIICSYTLTCWKNTHTQSLRTHYHVYSLPLIYYLLTVIIYLFFTVIYGYFVCDNQPTLCTQAWVNAEFHTSSLWDSLEFGVMLYLFIFFPSVYTVVICIFIHCFLSFLPFLSKLCNLRHVCQTPNPHWLLHIPTQNMSVWSCIAVTHF